ncbi:MAG: 1-acyl-sn-glycerol-3-phosphate acyltransferase [Bacteroidia bacterium]|nr:1-acyl-sn-glycerol-3-phosphate acyltransferase [Bacteroidia bacterium]
MPEAEQKKFIDIEEVIRGKNPALLRWMPGFLLRYIKRIIHQDHINDFIRRHGDKQSHAFVNEIIKEFGAEVTFEGLENLPASGGCIIAANHPIGGLDAMALIQVLAHKRKDIKFIVNDVLLSIKNLGEFFVGVNKHGKNTTEVLDLIDSFYAGEGLMLIFPAGLVSRKQNDGLIRDLVWKKSFIVKAKKFRRDIVPVHIAGRNSAFFYNLARLRTRLGIKANIEMFYLMDEMYHQLGKNIHVRIGKPIAYETFGSTYNDHEWAQKVKEHIYNLAEGKDHFQA